MKPNVEGIKDLKQLLSSVNKATQTVQFYDGQEVNLNTASPFVPDGMGNDRVVSDDDQSTAEEKLKFITENPELDRWLQSLRNDIQKAFK